ncbi:hypothetical protein MMC14_006819 [Varicellaria rhodocarpa]|nr:hypothetical protein [Varicellaria rhodocarpa]
MYEKIPNVVDLHTKLALEEKAVRMLERVKVMRTFDFAGVVEATSEVRDLWETLEREKEQNHEISKPIGEIPNSQDSDDEDLTTTDTKTELPPTITTSGGIRLIIIDNIANVTSSTMATSQTQGQALLISFLRSLRTLTITYHICTLMINAAVGLAPTTTITPHFNYYKRRQPEENNASIFSSTFGRPALGKAYAHLIDTSIFLSRIPRTKEDVQLAYGGSNSGGEGKKWDSVGVFEVLRDRYGTREGRWATFEMGARVKIR